MTAFRFIEQSADRRTAMPGRPRSIAIGGFFALPAGSRAPRAVRTQAARKGIAAHLFASRGDAPSSAPVFESVRNPGHALTERAVNYIIKAVAQRAGVNPAASVHWLRHAHASHAIDNGAPITLMSATLGHADLKTTSVYAHARPGESSGRYLKTK
jgi:site-specific recombinase XerD